MSAPPVPLPNPPEQTLILTRCGRCRYNLSTTTLNARWRTPDVPPIHVFCPLCDTIQTGEHITKCRKSKNLFCYFRRRQCWCCGNHTDPTRNRCFHCHYPLDGACRWVWVQVKTEVRRGLLYLEHLGGTHGPQRPAEEFMKEIMQYRRIENLKIGKRWKMKKDTKLGMVMPWVDITEAREYEERRAEKVRKKEAKAKKAEAKERGLEGGQKMVEIGRRVWKWVGGGKGKENKIKTKKKA